MIKKLILICALLPLIASCAIKAADYGLSEEEFNARKKQFDSICKGQETKCRRSPVNNPPIFNFRYFLNNYDRYNKYPLDILRDALELSDAGAPQGLSDSDVNAYLLSMSEAISKKRAEKKIEEEKRIAKAKKEAEEEAAEWARLHKKYPGVCHECILRMQCCTEDEGRSLEGSVQTRPSNHLELLP